MGNAIGKRRPPAGERQNTPEIVSAKTPPKQHKPTIGDCVRVGPQYPIRSSPVVTETTGTLLGRITRLNSSCGKFVTVEWSSGLVESNLRFGERRNFDVVYAPSVDAPGTGSAVDPITEALASTSKSSEAKGCILCRNKKFIGLRVVRGPRWNLNCLVDSFGAGTIIHVHKPGLATVKWDSGRLLECHFTGTVSEEAEILPLIVLERDAKLLIGLRVMRGPSWNYGLEDSFGPGVVTALGNNPRTVVVLWDSNTNGCYRWGEEGNFDLSIAPEAGGNAFPEELLNKSVIRGPNWQWGDDDGNSVGQVILSEKNERGWVCVRWQHGATGSYRWGASGSIDLEPCLPSGDKLLSSSEIVGKTVVRGPDWEYGNQDENESGVVVSVHPEDTQAVLVQWKSTDAWAYRFGASACFDVSLSTTSVPALPSTSNSTTAQGKGQPQLPAPQVAPRIEATPPPSVQPVQAVQPVARTPQTQPQAQRQSISPSVKPDQDLLIEILVSFITATVNEFNLGISPNQAYDLCLQLKDVWGNARLPTREEVSNDIFCLLTGDGDLTLVRELHQAQSATGVANSTLVETTGSTATSTATPTVSTSSSASISNSTLTSKSTTSNPVTATSTPSSTSNSATPTSTATATSTASSTSCSATSTSVSSTATTSTSTSTSTSNSTPTSISCSKKISPNIPLSLPLNFEEQTDALRLFLPEISGRRLAAYCLELSTLIKDTGFPLLDTIKALFLLLSSAKTLPALEDIIGELSNSDDSIPETHPRKCSWNEITNRIRIDVGYRPSSPQYGDQIAREDFSTRRDAFMSALKRRHGEDRQRGFLIDYITSNTTNISYDPERTMEFLKGFESHSAEDLQRTVLIRWSGSDAVDMGGVSKAVLCDFAKKTRREQHYLAFRGDREIAYISLAALGDSDSKTYFRALGKLAGFSLLHISEGFVLPLRLSSAFFSVLLGLPLTFRDLEEMDQALMNGLRRLYESTPEGIVAADQRFELDTEFTFFAPIELKPNGSNIEVTENNAEEFIELVLKLYLGSHAKMQEMLRNFAEGFSELIPSGLLGIFTPKEVQRLVCGDDFPDPRDLFSNLLWTCDGAVLDLGESPRKFSKGTLRDPGSNHQHIYQWLEILLLTVFSREQLALFSRFLTGCDVPPVGGYSSLFDKPVTIHFVATRGEQYPVAHVCSNTLDLSSNYSSQEKLQEHILEAIATQGFQLR
ncbi:E3 ubiquitin-protein ligase NEDD4 [Pelomyxa schiedti]|nr:E3 ubiquitin-protein ligase NEDD4 [Pelomyxa schiedti]